MMAKIPTRIKRIAKLTPYSTKLVVDLGTDHGYLPVLLISWGKSNKVIASDIAALPLKQARETLKKFNVESKVELRQGDGLSVLKEGEFPDVIVIAGIGGNNILEILSQAENTWNHGGEVSLIIQPMDEIKAVRKFLLDSGFAIETEDIVKERQKLYPIIHFCPGFEKVQDDVILELGPRLIESPKWEFVEYLDYVIARKEKKIMNLKKAKKQDELIKEKLEKVMNDLNKIKEVKRVVLKRMADNTKN